MRTAIIIPARYGSTRFPGKLLAQLAGKPIIQRVYEQALSVHANYTVVATDDERIADVIHALGGDVAMTSDQHTTGTARVAEAMHMLPTPVDIIINVQGDEPFVSPEAIQQLKALMEKPEVTIGTLQTPIHNPDWLQDEHKVKVVSTQEQEVLYFSRAAIPHRRGKAVAEWSAGFPYHLHVGMYGFKASVLQQLTALPPSPLAEVESLEQLQWMDHGYRIHVATTDHMSFGIDTPADWEAAEAILQKSGR